MTMEFIFLTLIALLLSSGPSAESTAATAKSTPTMTRTTIPPRGCSHNGKNHADGATITKDRYNCHGLLCKRGVVVAWDAKCSFVTPHCNGWTERVLGECCPLCHNVTSVPATSPSSSRPIPQGACVYDKKIYTNGEYVKKSPNNCSGLKCDNGIVKTWKENCWYPPTACKGEWINITGQCCNVCINETTTPIGGPQQRCQIGNRHYTVGQRTNTDPCNVCTCTTGRTEACLNITCNGTVLDCEVKYKPVGTCCYTCGSSQLMTSILLLLTSFLAS